MILASVLTQSRPKELSLVLDRLLESEELGAILVVQNPGSEAVTEVIREYSIRDRRVTHLKLRRNMAGGGGQNAACCYTLAHGYEAAVLMDDDCIPQPGAMDTLIRAWRGRKNRDSLVVAPLVEDPSTGKLSFGLWQTERGLPRAPHSLIWDRERAAALAGPEGFYRGWACVYLGTLIPSKVVRRVGAPIPELFLRGDEVEYLYRIIRMGFSAETLVSCSFSHPSDSSALTPLKRYFMLRNGTWIQRKYFPSTTGFLRMRGSIIVRRLLKRSKQTTADAISAGLRGDWRMPSEQPALGKPARAPRTVQ